MITIPLPPLTQRKSLDHPQLFLPLINSPLVILSVCLLCLHITHFEIVSSTPIRYTRRSDDVNAVLFIDARKMNIILRRHSYAPICIDITPMVNAILSVNTVNAPSPTNLTSALISPARNPLRCGVRFTHPTVNLRLRKCRDVRRYGMCASMQHYGHQRPHLLRYHHSDSIYSEDDKKCLMKPNA